MVRKRGVYTGHDKKMKLKIDIFIVIFNQVYR